MRCCASEEKAKKRRIVSDDSAINFLSKTENSPYEIHLNQSFCLTRQCLIFYNYNSLARHTRNAPTLLIKLAILNLTRVMHQDSSVQGGSAGFRHRNSVGRVADL